jgi:hypothetical protein
LDSTTRASSGSVIGLLASVGVTVYIVRYQARIDRERIIDDRRDEACLKLLEVVHNMSKQIDDRFAMNERAFKDAQTPEKQGERQAQLLSKVLRLETDQEVLTMIMAYMRESHAKD